MTKPLHSLTNLLTPYSDPPSALPSRAYPIYVYLYSSIRSTSFRLEGQHSQPLLGDALHAAPHSRPFLPHPSSIHRAHSRQTSVGPGQERRDAPAEGYPSVLWGTPIRRLRDISQPAEGYPSPQAQPTSASVSPLPQPLPLGPHLARPLAQASAAFRPEHLPHDAVTALPSSPQQRCDEAHKASQATQSRHYVIN